jgi:hypothetical protein
VFYQIFKTLINNSYQIKIGCSCFNFRSDKTRTANVLNCFKNDRSGKFIGEVIFVKYVV